MILQAFASFHTKLQLWFCILNPSTCLQKHNLRKPNCQTLQKMYLFLAPPLLWALSRTCLLSLVILNVFTLFVITILKPIVK